MAALKVVSASLALFYCLAPAASQELSLPAPTEEPLSSSFLSEPQDIRVQEGTNIQIDCLVELPQGFPVVLKNESSYLSMGAQGFPSSDRIELDLRPSEGFYRLHINDVRLEDEGNYLCEVPPSQIQTSTLTVYIPPTITLKPDIGNFDLDVGGAVELECTAHAKPDATIIWSRIGANLPDGQPSLASEELRLSDVVATDAGVYECMATNGVTDPVTELVEINVHFPPIVEVEETLIHTGPGHEVAIICTFRASPQADVMWLHNKSDIDYETRSNLKTGHENSDGIDKYIIKIRDVQPQDLGVYRCLGSNNRGDDMQEIVLSAEPYGLEIISEQTGEYSDEYMLEWKVNTLAQLVEFQLLYREVNASDDTVVWQNSSIPAPRDHLMPLHIQQRRLEGLAPNSAHVVRLRARNVFGTSDWSRDFAFRTAPEGNPAPLPTTPQPTLASTPSARPTPPTPREQVEGLGGAGGTSGLHSANSQMVAVTTMLLLLLLSPLLRTRLL